MRRKKALKRSRRIPVLVPILLAGSVGYLLGSAHITALRGTDLSATEAVALRFPQNWKNASLATATAIRTAVLKLHTLKSVNVASAGAITADSQFALLSPAPMAPQPAHQAVSAIAPQADQDPQAAIQTASAEQTDAAPSVSIVPQTTPPRAQTPSPKSAPVASQPAPAQKAAVPAPHPHINDRPGYVLNDTQIASIKGRLHLTPDQEQMWPAVEAALRNIAYARAQQARESHGPHGRGAPLSDTQTAAVDPNAVQGLKSAAVPLIMSFNAEQKEEVRNLAHVMGLDQLASQF
jgi:hypothetical protein